MANKGYNFEKYITNVFRDRFEKLLNSSTTNNKIFRVIGSGRNKNATVTGSDTLLEGDVSIELSEFPKNFLIECKHHKSYSKRESSHTVKKVWLDKALHDAKKHDRISIVAIKFKNISPNESSLKEYCWYDGKFSNSIHYIIPELHFLEIMEWCLQSKGTKTLEQFSDKELINEIEKRLKRKNYV